MKPRTLVLVLALVAPATIVAVPPQVAASCNPGRNNISHIRWAGTVSGALGAVRNIRGNVEEYSPYVALDAPTSAWVMLFRGSTGWAQAGWWKFSSGVRQAFVQWTTNGSWDTEVFAASAVGTFPTYQVIYNPAAGGANSEFVFERNNSVLWRVSPATFVPDAVQANGETHNDRNQMPGGFNSPVYLDQVQYTVGGGWIDINTPALATDPTIHGVVKANAHLYKIWDKACPT